MTLPDLVDVAIIGAGPAGLSAARHLAEAGIASVHVLEREAEAGAGCRSSLRMSWMMARKSESASSMSRS